MAQKKTTDLQFVQDAKLEQNYTNDLMVEENVRNVEKNSKKIVKKFGG